MEVKREKKKYIKAKIEIININKDEIITTSGANSFGNEYLSKTGYRL